LPFDNNPLEKFISNFINVSCTLDEVIEKINNNKQKILFVIDDNYKLLGSITDGDIRRSLLKKDNSINASTIMNANPIFALEGTDNEELGILYSSKGIKHIPILDKENRITDVQVLEDSSRRNYKNSVFLLAGGFGKRLYPLTKKVPKPLLNIGSKPILEKIIRKLISHGFSRFFISLHYKSNMIIDHLGDGSQWGIKIHYIIEEEPLGTAGSLTLIDRELKHPLIVMNADLLTTFDFESFLEFHNSNNVSASMCVRQYQFNVPFGVVHSNNEQVIRIEEKPVNNFLINAGIYLINPDVISNMTRGKYMDMPDLIQDLINNGKKVSSFPIYEYWLDIGTKDQYQIAIDNEKMS